MTRFEEIIEHRYAGGELALQIDCIEVAHRDTAKLNTAALIVEQRILVI